MVIIAAIVVPRISGLRQRAALNADAGSFASMSAAFAMYYADNGRFPPDMGPGNFPPAMKKYLRQTEWNRKPATGGVWDYNGPNAPYWPAPNVCINNNSDAGGSLPIWAVFDKLFDNGNVRTGGFFALASATRNYCTYVTP